MIITVALVLGVGLWRFCETAFYFSVHKFLRYQLHSGMNPDLRYLWTSTFWVWGCPPRCDLQSFGSSVTRVWLLEWRVVSLTLRRFRISS